MKKFWKIACFVFVPILLASCNSPKKTYSISFGGVGVVFDKESDKIQSGQDYTIGASAINGYSLKEENFTITVGSSTITSGVDTWNWSNNLLTIKGAIVTNNITVSATADLVEYSANVTAHEGITIGEYDHKVSIKKDFTVNIYVAQSKALKVEVTIGDAPSDKYSLNAVNLYYVLKINRDYINGDIKVDVYAVENDITVSTTAVSFLTYGNDAIEYSVPTSMDPDNVVATSSDTSLFTINQNKDTGKIYIESNLSNNSGTGLIKFANEGVLLNTTVSVSITNPTNIDEARDAFTLGAIKVSNNTNFKVTFAFNNTLDEDNFELSQEIYGRMNAAYFVDYSTGNRTNTFRVNTNTSFATTKSGMKEGDEYYRYNPNNINYLNHQDSSSHTFYIDTINRTLDVSNSEELFWAVEHGYRPIISDSNVQSIYDQARSLCLSVVNPNKTEFENFRIIFEALESKTHYDYWVIDQSSYWFTYTSYFLEGVFLDGGKAVCDGFSKAYALLCGIEGLPCVRSYGFSDDGGHAWNYIKLDGVWYLACPTWCKIGLETPDGDVVNIMNYEAFANSHDYFRNLGSSYTDLAFTTIAKSNTPYCSSTILSIDKTSDNTSFLIKSDADATKINTIIRSKIKSGEENYICFTYKSSEESKLNSWLQLMIKNVTNFDIYKVGEASTTDTYSYGWLYFIPA